MSTPTDPFLFVPVRHHSPACAHLIQRLFAEHAPSRVLIEGPSDFNEHLAELLLPHRLPIAIYSFIRTESERSGAYYPFCSYSPEWQAIQCAGAAAIPFSFIDLPWSALPRTEETSSDRTADGALRRSVLVDTLCKKLHVEDFDALWDTLFEIEPDLPTETLLTRLMEFCTALRTADENTSAVNPSDLAREAFMRAHLLEAKAGWADGDGPILVVTGGYHTAALTPLSPQRAAGPEERGTLGEEPGVRADISLTPYSYERLDSLTGYASGMPSPGFYHALWHGEPPLPLAVGTLRARKQPVSTADLITAEAMAQGLAALRGHCRVWRSDLLDGARSALVKEAIEGETHPLLAALLEAFRGGERGKLAPGTRLPPLTIEIAETLAQENLAPDVIERVVSFSLLEPHGRRQSQLLHCLAGLGIPGLMRTGGTNFATRDDLSQPHERWKLSWSPEFEGACIEAALYGATIPEAAIARLTERAEHAERDAEAAALLQLEAAQMGLALPLPPLIALLRAESDFSRLARALGHLLYLYRFDEALGTVGTEALAALLEEAFERGGWLLTGVTDGSPATLRGIAQLLEVWRRCQQQLSVRALRDVLQSAAYDRGRAPALRGAAVGALWSLGSAEDAALLELVGAFAQPDQLGDFLTGLFTLAREAARSTPELMLRLDTLLMAFSDDNFLQALPSLRLAFSFFPPREKHQLALMLLEAHGSSGEALPALVVGPAVAALALALEGKLFGFLERLCEPATREPSPLAPSPQEEGHPKASKSERAQAEDKQRKLRWRLVLGAGTEDLLGGLPSEGNWAEKEAALAYLYDREYGQERNVRTDNQHGSLDPSNLTVPDWINAIHELFPQRVIERIEKDALERYGLEEMVTNPALLARAQPSQTLLRAVLRTKHLMNPEVLTLARTLVQKVVQELLEKLATQVQSPFLGSVARKRSFLKVAKNFDVATTLRRNLRHWDTESQRLILKEPFFHSRIKRHVDKWQLLIVVDQSGSMVGSVIHAAVTAAIFFGIPAIKTRLILFDTSIVDVTDYCTDPVETLMKVQLGGGTDIGSALAYAETRIENPRRTIIVLITDFFEGADPRVLLGATKRLIESGVQLLGLAALDADANPTYDRELAGRMAGLGAHIGAMTPGELAEWVGEKVK